MTDERSSMSPGKRVAIQVGAGALLGLGSSSLAGPAVISWWYEPPSRDAFSCAGSVKNALSQFVVMQLTCAIVGGAAIAAIFFFARRAKTKPHSADA